MSSSLSWDSAPRPPRPWHRPAALAIEAEIRAGGAPLVSACTGCHPAATRVLMADGSERAVEDVRVGELLMGPDSQPREVLRLIRDEGEIVTIRPVKGEAWRANLDHVLSLVDTRDDVVSDVSIRDYLTWRPGAVHLNKLFRVGVDLPARPQPVDPYLLGILLGDGSIKRTIGITTMDPEIVAEIYAYALRYGCGVRVDSKPDNRARTYALVYRGSRGQRPHTSERAANRMRRMRAAGASLAAIGAATDRSSQYVHHRMAARPTRATPLRDGLESLGLIGLGAGAKFIPDCAKLGSRPQRLDVLAGLIDTDGSLSRGGYDYISKSERLARDVAWIARSVGLAAYVRPCEKRCQTGGGGTYYRVSISGDCSIVPCRIERKRCGPRNQIKSALRTGFRVIRDGRVEPFFGFTLAGDGRYLLADFTVTHNSGKSDLCAYLARRAASRGSVLIAVPSQALVRQLAASLAPWLPSAPGVWYADEKRLGASVTVCCFASLASVPVPPNLRLLILDEAHKSETEQVRAELPRLAPAHVVGVTATPYRTDRKSLGLFSRCVFRYSLQDATRDGVLVPLRRVWWNGQGAPAEDLDRVCLEMVRAAEGPGVLDALTIDDAERFSAWLSSQGFPALPIHSQHSPKENAARLSRLQGGSLRAVVHVSSLVEGVDLPWLSWSCMRRPVGSIGRVVQSLGRILRTSPGKSEAVVFDPLDTLASLGLGKESVGESLAEALDRLSEAEAEEPSLVPAPILLPPAVAVDELQQWARSALLALEAAGHAKIPGRATGAGWATDAQRQRLSRLWNVGRWINEDARIAARAMIDHADDLTYGQAADVIDLLQAAASARDAAMQRHPGRWPAIQKEIRSKLSAWPAPPAAAVESLVSQRRAA